MTIVAWRSTRRNRRPRSQRWMTRNLTRCFKVNLSKSALIRRWPGFRTTLSMVALRLSTRPCKRITWICSWALRLRKLINLDSAIWGTKSPLFQMSHCPPTRGLLVKVVFRLVKFHHRLSSSRCQLAINSSQDSKTSSSSNFKQDNEWLREKTRKVKTLNCSTMVDRYI